MSQRVTASSGRNKEFSQEQNIRKKDYMEKHKYVILEDIVGDVIVKDSTKFKVEFPDGATKTMDELVMLNKNVATLRKSGMKKMLLELLGVK